MARSHSSTWYALKRLLQAGAAVVLLGGSGGAWIAVTNPTPGYTGSFNITVRGFWAGQGQAQVTLNSIDLQATVMDDQGNKGQLIAQHLTIRGEHFSGTGSVLGLPVSIEGRVEAPDQPPAGSSAGTRPARRRLPQRAPSPVLTDARIGCTFTANGHSGRIAGGRN